MNAVVQKKGNMMQRAVRLAEITQGVGFALWQLQELEGSTALYFVLVAQARMNWTPFVGPRGDGFKV